MKLEEFIFKLTEKHPDTVVFTGNGKGSEKKASALVEALGLTVIRPEIHEDWFGDEALVCQVHDILIDSGLTSPLVLVGSGERVTRAKDILKRISPYQENQRIVHEIAKVPTKERAPAPRKAKKPVHD